MLAFVEAGTETFRTAERDNFRGTRSQPAVAFDVPLTGVTPPLATSCEFRP